MKTKFILLTALQFIFCCSFSQYIGVKARYTETKMSDDSPNPPKREDRLILSFFQVTTSGKYIPVVLSNYEIWIYKLGLQYGSFIGGVLDSSGNNYPGYPWTAPKVVSYYNSYFPNYIDCDPNAATHYTVNGHELDCGFIPVSSWDAGAETFNAPNVCLPYYFSPNPFASAPGNVNFFWPIVPTAPYNWYSFSCAGSPQQLVIRGVLPQDSSEGEGPLPIKFDNVKLSLYSKGIVINWSNMTESDIDHYTIERSADGIYFLPAGTVLPTLNNGSEADHEFLDSATGSSTKLFYRIRAVETNGHYLYSKIVSINKFILQNCFLSVYPNPVRNGRLTVQLSDAEKGIYSMWLVNAQGRSILLKEIQHVGGSMLQTVDLRNSTAGAYFIIIRSVNGELTKKIIIE